MSSGQFKLPELPKDLTLKPTPQVKPKPSAHRSRSSTVGSASTYDGPATKGVSSPSLVKPSSMKQGVSSDNKKTSLDSKLFDFYDKTVAETERIVEAIPDDSATKKLKTRAKEILQNARIPPGMRGKMTGEMFWSKAEQVISVRECIQFENISLQPPPTYVRMRTSSLHSRVAGCATAQQVGGNPQGSHLKNSQHKKNARCSSGWCA